MLRHCRRFVLGALLAAFGGAVWMAAEQPVYKGEHGLRAPQLCLQMFAVPGPGKCMPFRREQP